MKGKINYILILIAMVCIFYIYKLSRKEVVDNSTLLYDILIGVLVSVIFYFIVDYIPEYRKKLLGFRLIQVELSNVLANIETILSINRDFFSIDKELRDIVLRDWKVMFNKRDTTSLQFIMYEKSFKNKKCKVSNNYYIPDPVTGPSNLNNVVRNSLKKIEASLNVIFTYESYFVNDTNFFEYLTKLKNSKLIEWYTDKYEFNYMSNTYEYIYGLQKIYFALKKFNIHYYERKSFIDTSEKAIEYQKEYNSGGTKRSLLSFYERKKVVMSSTTRITYFKKRDYADYISKEIASDFQTELCEYKRINEVELSSDLNVVIANVFSTIYLFLKYQKKDNLVFFIIQTRFLGLLIKLSKIFKVNNTNITICLIPTSFQLLGKNINREEPSVRCIGIITQEIDKQFNNQHNLHLK